ncbi:hypothetical protein TRFO_36450 [Tritrichomonas foetus]|uniref:DUF3447 domain-containing protein n=1 Tax=Tritrichomonas foetus TaxID=1144522 RepID=A0A1J4JDX4_9EUKA|nr:hypothetical protein TRFO_36450 [Tritrichomonas foetus]|eukprot:OHS97354.1 hypothetical protein TRFO_36450 [Tritrichomonas foetus]
MIFHNPEITDMFDEIIYIQNILLNVNELNEKDTFETIKNSFLINSKSYLKSLLSSIGAAFYSRPLKSNFYFKIINNISEILKLHFSSKELLQIFDFYQYKYLILHMYEIGLINIQSIQYLSIDDSLCFIYFWPEIKKYFPEYFEQQISLSLYKKDQIERYSEEDHIYYRSFGSNEHPLALIVRNDDINEFQNIISCSDFDLNMVMPTSQYEQCEFVFDQTSLIEYSAFFGAEKIFKFLYLNHIPISSKISRYAVAGGNTEIIHLIERHEISFYRCLEIAIEFHQNEVVRYFIENGFLIEAPALYFCIELYNIECFIDVLKHMLNNGLSKEAYGWALSDSAALGHADIVESLLYLPNFDVNQEHLNGV